jgi:2-desacetyl-2-hydroxyethyl bacteriochlorophyllide A dehydrogenase
MLAVVYHGPNDLRVEQVPAPATGPGEILVKVHSASICGTDLRIWRGQHRQYPAGTVRTPGHEVVGTIAEISPGIPEYRVGQMVFCAPNTGCGHCAQCTRGNNNLCSNYEALGVTVDGGFAEYVRISARSVQQGNVIPVAEGVDPAVAALLEPFACVVRGQNALSIRPGDVVLVMGAGPIGVMHTKLAKARGAGKVIVSEPLADRRAQASSMGADHAVDPSAQDLQTAVRAESGGRGADVVIVAAPAHVAQEAAIQVAAIGGRINFFGGLPKDRSTVSIDSNAIHYKELIVTGTTACSTADCWQAASIVGAGLVDLSTLVSRRFALKDADQAFAAAEDRGSLKVVLQP